MNGNSNSEPNTELLRIQGWSVISTFGLYCTAWKGDCERLFVWLGDHWQMMLAGQGAGG